MSTDCTNHAYSRREPQGSVIIVVLWAIAIAALITTAVQLFSHRQATLGREALERVQARWAARAGIEYTMAVMRDFTERPDPDDAFAMKRAMNVVARGETVSATWDIAHHVDGRTLPGPMDEHSKININRSEDRGLLMVLEDMTYDIYDAINDWVDQDSEPSVLGVEREYYQGLPAPYEPRNGSLRSTAEMELIAGVWPLYFRGEDWNLDGRLDPRENDSRRSFPPDNNDGRLDAGWSGAVTVHTVPGGATASGQPRLHLKTAEIADITERLGITEAQAQFLQNYGRTEQNRLERLIVSQNQDENEDEEGGSAGGTGGTGRRGGTGTGGRNTGTPTPNQRGSGGRDGAGGNNRGAASQAGENPAAFNARELRNILNETVIEDPYERKPGLMNINSVPAPLLRDILEKGLSLDDAIADEIIYMRESHAEGIVSALDFQKIPGVDARILDLLVTRFGTTSNVFTISSRGRSWASGAEIEIVAVVDRSTVPVRIIEYREQ